MKQLNKKWFDLFNEHILKKGYYCYLEDETLEKSIEENKISAIVAGQENYNVTINLNNQNIDSMSCTCRYANKGNHCKHMAAVLFEADPSSIEEYERQDDLLDQLRLLQDYDLERYQFFDDEEYDDTDDFDMLRDDNYQYYDYLNTIHNQNDQISLLNDLSDIIESLSDEMAKVCLTSQVLSNKQQLEQFTYTIFGFINIDLDSTIIENYTNPITKIYENYNSILVPTEENQIKFLNDLYTYLVNDIFPLYQQKEYSYLLKTCSYCISVISNATDDMITIKQVEEKLLQEILYIWSLLYETDDYKIINELFRTIYYYQYLNSDIIIEQYIDDFLYDYFKENHEFLVYKLNHADEMITLFESNARINQTEDLLALWCGRYFDILVELGVDSDTLNEFIIDHYSLREFRMFLVNRYLDLSDFHEALDILKDSIEIDSDNSDHVYEYKNTIEEIMKYMNN